MPQPLPPIDTARILAGIDAIRRQIPDLETATAVRAAAEQVEEWSALLPPAGASAEETEQLMIEFDYLSVARALEELAEDLGAEIERKQQRVLEQCLDVYYAAQELVEQGRTDLIPQVEEMERAYRNDFGKEIPPRARRRQ